MTVVELSADWVLVELLPDGHRLFKLYSEGIETGLLGIADDSGNTPSDTDDGALFLDRSRPLIAEYADTCPHLSIPLISGREHTKTRTITDMPTLLRLAGLFHWDIVAISGDTVRRYAVSEKESIDD